MLCDECRETARQARNKVWADRGPRPPDRYGPEHRKARAEWVPIVEAGGVVCPYCRHLIQPGTPWHLGHPEDDKTREPSPWHAKCNTQYAAAVTAHIRRRAQKNSKK
jgi:hypothetical protein